MPPLPAALYWTPQVESSLPRELREEFRVSSAARSLSLTRSHSLALGSPHLCPTLLVLRNSGPTQPEPSR
ncbi:hypothetical protein NDU88_002873 [Pleurodeles waltl]|uniref:Uncharacterized protein n=1 Tax=Pleurodeles waltl TaxID=8319 RepID=A0AAV7W4L6_PLEWA|nr:hypothetical protein NDU88_002873 [Pleurodeles waltl]